MIELDLEAVGARIAYYRKLNGLSAQKLADMVGGGLTRGKLAHIETQTRQTLDVGTLLGIAWALKVPPIALLFDLREPDAPIRATRMKPNPSKLTWTTADVEGSAWEIIKWFQGWVPWLEHEGTDAQHETAEQLQLLQDVAARELDLEAVESSSRLDLESYQDQWAAQTEVNNAVENAREAGINFAPRNSETPPDSLD